MAGRIQSPIRLLTGGNPQRALGRLARAIRPWHVVAVFALAYLGTVLAAHGGDPMSLVRVGTRFDPGEPGGTLGYDGQFAWQIGRDPAQGWQRVDKPAYRYQRILYPALARLVALGRTDWLPWALLGVNALALVLGTAATEALLEQFGAGRWFALVYGLNIGMLMAVRLDLTEPLAFTLFQLGALAVARQRWLVGAVVFGLACLAKEVVIILVGGYGLYLLIRRRWQLAFLTGVLALGPLLVWEGVLYVWLGSVGFDSGGAFATGFQWVPLGGWWSLAAYDLRWFGLMSLLLVPLVILPALLVLGHAIRTLRSGRPHPTTLAVFLQALAVLFLPASNLLDPLGVSRFAVGLIAALLAYGAQTGSRRVLMYTQLWMVTVAFVFGDSFLPRA